MGRVILLDIDNCISDDGWRINRIDWGTYDKFYRYHAYHMLAPWDACGNRDLFEHEGGRRHVVLLTSRPVHYRVHTVEWLQRNGVWYSHLLMRNDHDHRPSTSIKRSMVESLIEYGIHRSQIECAYDDREEVCAMYRSLGIKAEQRSLHSISAYHNPVTGMNHADGTNTL